MPQQPGQPAARQLATRRCGKTEPCGEAQTPERSVRCSGGICRGEQGAARGRSSEGTRSSASAVGERGGTTGGMNCGEERSGSVCQGGATLRVQSGRGNGARGEEGGEPAACACVTIILRASGDSILSEERRAQVCDDRKRVGVAILCRCVCAVL